MSQNLFKKPKPHPKEKKEKAVCAKNNFKSAFCLYSNGEEDPQIKTIQSMLGKSL